MGEEVRGESAPRVVIAFYCEHGHVTSPSFATDAAVPELWDCARCGLPAGRDADNPPPAPKNEPYKTHLAYVKERRSDAEAEQILLEALQGLRDRVGRGEIYL